MTVMIAMLLLDVKNTWGRRLTKLATSQGSHQEVRGVQRVDVVGRERASLPSGVWCAPTVIAQGHSLHARMHPLLLLRSHNACVAAATVQAQTVRHRSRGKHRCTSIPAASVCRRVKLSSTGRTVTV